MIKIIFLTKTVKSWHPWKFDLNQVSNSWTSSSWKKILQQQLRWCEPRRCLSRKKGCLLYMYMMEWVAISIQSNATDVISFLLCMRIFQCDVLTCIIFYGSIIKCLLGFLIIFIVANIANTIQFHSFKVDILFSSTKL